MCTLALVWQTHPDYPLLLASNRDEFLQRPTQVASIWPENPNCIGGKDLEAGGSWLLASPEGRWAVLTNYRDGRNLEAGKVSRGNLVQEAISQPLAGFSSWLVKNAKQFAGFNLIWGTANQAWYFTNAGEQAALGIQALKAGVYTLSNANLNTPWPKTLLLKELIANWLAQPKPKLANIFAILENTQQAAAKDLPNTYINPAMEQLLSSIFISSSDYATRTSSLLYSTNNNLWHLHEKTHAYPQQAAQEIQLTWQVN